MRMLHNFCDTQVGWRSISPSIAPECTVSSVMEALTPLDKSFLLNFKVRAEMGHLTFASHMAHNRIQISKPKNVPGQSRHLQSKITRSNSPLTIRASIEQSRLNESILAFVQRIGKFEGDCNGFLCIHRTKFQIRRRAFVKIPMVFYNT